MQQDAKCHMARVESFGCVQKREEKNSSRQTTKRRHKKGFGKHIDKDVHIYINHLS